MSAKKAVKIVIEYDDGSVDLAEGTAADHIKRWYDAGEVMNCLHGAIYKGPRFQELTAEEVRKP